MLNKRQFIQRTAAVAAAASAMRFGGVAAAMEGNPIALAVFDQRYRDSRLFASALGARGAEIHATEQDLSRLWFAGLRERLAAPGARIAGMTPYSDLFIMSSFAAELGRKVRFEAWHDCRGCETFTHSLKAGALTPAVEAAMRGKQEDWPMALAHALETGFGGVAEQGANPVLTGAERRHDHPGMLVTWVIA